ncbi:transposase domain-containing protein [Streptomyces olivaceus]
MAHFVTGGISDVFAPGHIGELTQVIPPELVDAVVEETGVRERRLRSLPSRVGVYFVLALGLFEHLGAQLVWGKLVAGLSVNVPQPSEKALRDLRRRVGARLHSTAAEACRSLTMSATGRGSGSPYGVTTLPDTPG